jgi:hypothetical protein
VVVLLKKKIKKYERGLLRTSRAFGELLEAHSKDRSRSINSDNVNIENFRPDSDYDGLYIQTQREST